MKSFSDDLAGVGDQYKCRRFLLFDEISQLYGLHPVQSRQDQVFVFP